VALHSHVSRQICGREDERRLIEQFCAQKCNNENGDINNPCLYIYGAPGTGENNQRNSTIKTIFLIN
jgi:Cdc6-like AAA superfamily ATPase